MTGSVYLLRALRTLAVGIGALVAGLVALFGLIYIGGEYGASWAAGLLAAVPLYLLPAGIAYQRRTDARGVILAANLTLGWTGLGWLWVLVWALMGPREG